MVVIKDIATGRTYKIDKNMLSIGSGQDNDVQAPTPGYLQFVRTSGFDSKFLGIDGVSERHAELMIVGGDIFLRDSDSRTGTFISRYDMRRWFSKRERIGTHCAYLREGDVFTVGKYPLQLVSKS